MERKKHHITQAEWNIMQVLWESETATAAEIVNIVSSKSQTSMRTVKTLIRRLVAKGAVAYSVDSKDLRVYHYYAVVDKELCITEKTDILLNTVFGNNTGDMLLGFLGDAKLNISEIEKLEKLLKKKRDELGDDS